MNINLKRQSNMMTSFFSSNTGLKSTQEKQERQMESEKKINFWKEQKEKLKTMQCDTLEDISQKLKLFHSYEEEIRAAKIAYNNEQMWHIMDEAREMGEKIAEAAEEQKAKTPEERAEEKREEALGTEEEKSEVSELLEDMVDLEEELVEELTEELQEELKDQENISTKELSIEEIKEQQKMQDEKQIIQEEIIQKYKRFDKRV